MGKLGRFACTFTPMALSIASLVCLVLVLLGNLSPARSYYFFYVSPSSPCTCISISNAH